ncbi:hypothetical protein CAPTEDRAFT_217562 [Capitella teleta]|uniref:Transmembrane protein 220 n=1 Tax=Capitella teleta TaxID=283909 RepID=R7THW5_CAPTE|nr:hypothetical protein CAPTEDRAFT_217562 [Capitella teleta]|eukprot:ELT91151.1 hypothetical protein CAPTEDRAFT_217562 [Capitella teleta]
MKVKYSKLETSAEDEQGGKSSPEENGSNKWRNIWRSINAVMTLFFSLSAYVQLNDPDPYIWIPVYAVPAVLSLSMCVHPTVPSHPVWRTVCVLHIALCVAGALYLLAVMIEILTGKIVNPLLHEEGRRVPFLI